MSRGWQLLPLLCLLAPQARAAAPAQGYWGVAVGLYPGESARQGLAYPPPLAEVRGLGAGHVLLSVSWEQRDRQASRVEPGDSSLSDAQLREAMARARDAGLRVVLAPQLRLQQGAQGDWRGSIAPRDPQRWWRDYERFINHYARLAQEQDVALFAVGHELTSMSGPSQLAHWKRLTRQVRQLYGGPIAFVANHDALDRRTPMALVDVVGVSAYFSLSTQLRPRQRELSQRWRQIADELAELQRSVQRPLVLFEVGYASRDGAARRPWDYTGGNPVDLEEQRMAYRACADALLASPWISGALFWQWFGDGGRFDRHYTPRGKPALGELRRLLRLTASRSPG